MDKEKLLQELEKKKQELYEIEKALAMTEEKELSEYTVDTEQLLREIKNFPRYFINKKGEVFHETGLALPFFEKNNKTFVKIFDTENNLKEVSIEELLKENF